MFRRKKTNETEERLALGGGTRAIADEFEALVTQVNIGDQAAPDREPSKEDVEREWTEIVRNAVSTVYDGWDTYIWMLDFGTDVIALARLIIIALEDGSATNWALAAVQGGFIALYLRLSTFIFAMCGASRVTFGRTVFNFSIEDPGHPNRQVSLLYLLLLWLPPPFSIFLDASGIVPFRYRIHAYDAFDDYASSGRHVVDEMRSNRDTLASRLPRAYKWVGYFTMTLRKLPGRTKWLAIASVPFVILAYVLVFAYNLAVSLALKCYAAALWSGWGVAGMLGFGWAISTSRPAYMLDDNPIKEGAKEGANVADGAVVTVSRESTCPRFCGPPEGVPQGTFHRRKRALPDVYAGARGAWIFMEKAKYLGDHGLPVTHRVMTEDDYERATRQLGVLLPAREFALDKTVPKPIRYTAAVFICTAAFFRALSNEIAVLVSAGQMPICIIDNAIGVIINIFSNFFDWLLFRKPNMQELQRRAQQQAVMEWMSIVEVVFEAVPSLVTIAIAIYRQGADALLVLSISVSALAALHALFTVLKQYSESSILREVARRGVLECFGRPQFYKHVTWASFKNVAEGLHPLGFEAIRSSKDAGVGAVVVITLRVDVQHLEKALAGASGGRISRAGLRMAAKEGSEAAARFLAGRVRQGIGRMTRDEPLRMALFRAVTREVQQRLVGQKDALFKHWDNIESWVHSLALHSVKGARAVGDTIEVRCHLPALEGVPDVFSVLMCGKPAKISMPHLKEGTSVTLLRTRRLWNGEVVSREETVTLTTQEPEREAMQEVIGAATQAMADLRWNSVVSALGLSSDLVVPPTVDLSKLTIRLLADFSEPVSQAESLLHKPNLPVDLYEDLIYSAASDMEQLDDLKQTPLMDLASKSALWMRKKPKRMWYHPLVECLRQEGPNIGTRAVVPSGYPEEAVLAAKALLELLHFDGPGKAPQAQVAIVKKFLADYAVELQDLEAEHSITSILLAMRSIAAAERGMKQAQERRRLGFPEKLAEEACQERLAYAKAKLEHAVEVASTYPRFHFVRSLVGFPGTVPLCRHIESPVRLFLVLGANVHHRDIDGFTALHRACQFPTEDAPDVVRDLIRYGAEVDARTESGLTPLLLACQFLTPSSVSVVRILLENGADPAAADDKGNTALHALACQAWSFTTLREAGLFEGNAKAIGTVEKKRKGCSREKKGMDVVVVRDKDDRLGAVLLDARKWGKKAKVKKRRTDGDLLELVEAQPRGGVKGQGMQDPVPESESDEEAFGMASGGLAALGRLVRWMWGGIWEAEDVVGKRRWARDLNAGRRRRWGMAAWLEYAPFKVALTNAMATLWSRTAEDLPQEKEIVPVPLGRACLERAMVIAEMLLMPPTEMEGVNIGATNADGDTALDLARAAGNYLHKLAAAIAPVAIKHLRDAAGLKPDELSVLFKNFPVERVLQEDLRRVMDACGSHSVPKVMIRRVAALRQLHVAFSNQPFVDMIECVSHAWSHERGLRNASSRLANFWDDMRPEEDDLKETGKKRKRQRKDGQVDYVFGVSAEELDKYGILRKSRKPWVNDLIPTERLERQSGKRIKK